MIHSIKVNKSDIAKHPSFHYISELEGFPDEISFSSGINIIIGKNGVGKSTILNIIREYFMIDEFEYHSPIDVNTASSKCFYKSIKSSGFDCINVIADYTRTMFSYPDRIPTQEHECKSASDIARIFHSSRSSAGENRLSRLDKLFNTMFGSNEILKFPYQEFEDLVKVWYNTGESPQRKYWDYISKNHKESDEFTILFDEPDMNLDIDNLDQIVSILSTRKEMTQVIAVVHNPLVIHILSKLDYINFIELTPSYLQKVNAKISKYTHNRFVYEKF